MKITYKEFAKANGWTNEEFTEEMFRTVASLGTMIIDDTDKPSCEKSFNYNDNAVVTVKVSIEKKI